MTPSEEIEQIMGEIGGLHKQMVSLQDRLKDAMERQMYQGIDHPSVLLNTHPTQGRMADVMSILIGRYPHGIGTKELDNVMFETDRDPPLDAPGVRRVSIRRLRVLLKGSGWVIINLDQFGVVSPKGSFYQLRKAEA